MCHDLLNCHKVVKRRAPRGWIPTVLLEPGTLLWQHVVYLLSVMGEIRRLLKNNLFQAQQQLQALPLVPPPA
jgi:hypothetical protein